MSKMLPHSHDAERNVITGMLLSEVLRDRGLEVLTSGDFHSIVMRKAFDTSKELGEGANLVSVGQALSDSGDLEDLGGTHVISDMASGSISDQFFEASLKIIKEKSALRTGARIADEMLAKLKEASRPDEVRETISRGLSDIGKATIQKEDPPTISEVMDSAWQRYQDRLAGKGNHAIETPWPSFNKTICGGIGPRYYVISAPTGGGKSTLAMNLIAPVVDTGGAVDIYSYEMSDLDLADRMSVMKARLNPNLIFNPEHHPPSESELEEMKEAAEYWKDTDVTIHSDPNITVEQIAIDARRAVRERDVKMIIVDYIQLVPVDKFQKDGLREQVVAFISRTLRNISLEHNIAVVALSQTNDDGAMRESRAIANDSEVILNVTKDGVFVFKQRNGPAKVMLPMFQQEGSFHFIDEADEGSMIDFGKEIESEEETYEDKEDDGIPF